MLISDPQMRPHIKKVRTMVNANLRSTGKGSLVDQMMKMMEEYTSNLENMVRDRTALLEEAQKQADRLLNSMLPKSIAEDLKVGKPVLPQLYQCATVLFSDIRGKSIAEDLKVGKPVLPQLYQCATVLFSDIRGKMFLTGLPHHYSNSLSLLLSLKKSCLKCKTVDFNPYLAVAFFALHPPYLQ
ncbi:unnamed protein product [Cylicostephanus goldi]|uniref:guanylate cyclase n=1 Tax=Cylicostephanus goldi TaxID=71465 RepID=A0A3P7M0V9_CYLGO|nr:unnamed protein product [Cylicostephanus goldi]